MTIIIDLTNWAHLAIIAVSLLILMGGSFLAGKVDCEGSKGTIVWGLTAIVLLLVLIVSFIMLIYQAL